MKTLLLILQLIPALFEVLKAVENMFPDGGQGEAKLKLVREMMEEAYDGIFDMWPTIETIITKVVGLANTLGVFDKGKKAGVAQLQV